MPNSYAWLYAAATDSHTRNNQEEKTIHVTSSYGVLAPSELRDLILQTLDAYKAEDTDCLTLTDQSVLADYMIVATGTSSRHVLGLMDKIKDKLHDYGFKGLKIEGQDSADWIVIDSGDVIVHLFRPEVRNFYNIEQMWAPNHGLKVVASGSAGARA